MRGPLPPQVHLDDLEADGASVAAASEAAQVDLRAELVLLGVRLREEEDSARGKAFAEPGQRLDRAPDPALRHPGDVRHHARALNRSLVVGRRLPEPVQLLLDVADGGAFQHS